ncbi:hypothetical protein [Nocardia sp. bgisy134]|uniref:hypothetical protein n=1 Tax=unclassified Nocardia TaxID=2637762 RepID=UPI003D705E65
MIVDTGDQLAFPNVSQEHKYLNRGRGESYQSGRRGAGSPHESLTAPPICPSSVVLTSMNHSGGVFEDGQTMRIPLWRSLSEVHTCRSSAATDADGIPK